MKKASIILPFAFLLMIAVGLLMRPGEGPAVEEGVSLALAQYRMEAVHDLRYSVAFSIPEEPDRRVTGQESISFSLKGNAAVRRPWEAPLQLDFREGREAVLALKVNGRDCAVDYREEHIVLPARALRKGANTIELEFIAGDRSLNRNDDYLYTLFVPDRARTAFPCFDQPDLKGRFTLTLEVPAGWEAVANGALANESGANETAADGAGVGEGSDGERKRLCFNETPPLSTYLFAFAAGRWQKETRYRNGEPMSVYYRETDPAKTAQIDDIFSQVFLALEWMEEYTGIPRPFEKYDFVIVPSFQFGGMEHPGAILFNDRRMFLNSSPTTSERLDRMQLIAHETSHLWFGDAVTMRWFDDVWTKEVYANYFGSKISTPYFPEVNVPLRDFRDFNITAYSEDRTAGTNAIRRSLPNLSSAGLIYGNIVYDKAPVVMRMLSDLLGEQAFREGIREYLNAFLYDNATWNDLIAILDSKTDLDLRKWSRVWVEEKGMPTVSHSVRDGILTVRQEDPSGMGRVWPQRISFADVSGNTVASVWSDAPEVTAVLPEGCGTILLPDPDALSYGWFHLDGETSRAALRALPALPRPESRLSLLAALNENFLRGDLEPEAYAGALETLFRTEKDPLVAGSAASFLKTMSIHGPLAGSPVLEALLLKVASDTSVPDEIRLTAFRSLASVFRSEKNLDLFMEVFEKARGFKGLELSARDYMTLAYELAVRCPERFAQIRSLQEGRIGNPDLLREFRFVYRAVAPDKSERDALFASLLEAENRRVEPWTQSALAYLNHPLRQKEAVGHIYPGLEELPEIQRTGDIFFPKNWSVALLSGHDSPEAAAEVKRFLADHPDLPDLLKGKLLIAADHLLSR